jgi:two-component system chemotaxis sensor kinase CheA
VIDKLKEAFREEAGELVVELETALLELDQRRDDPETLGRAFRALHTIKGSGAMFGFEGIAGFAHHLESAFDRVRQGELAATEGLINLSLAAADQIKGMLRAGGAGAGDDERRSAILAELRRLTGGADAPGREAAAADAPAVEAHPADAGPVRAWRIHFRPAPGVLVNGTNPLLLLRELGELGPLETAVDASAIPPLEEMDPERCYTAWDLVLRTGAPREAIRDIFIFVEDHCELRIEAEAGEPERTEGVPAASGAGPAPGRQANASSIRVSAEKVDQLVNLVGELVTVQARLSELALRHGDSDIQAASEEIDRLTAELRENSMSIRMLPLRSTFERFRRLVHDLAIELHKEVELTVEGADTELDKTVIDQLNDPLVHLIRNSMDHGIETPEARRAAGKPPRGRIHISARHSGAQVLIRVSDDGRGLDAQAVRRRAVEQRLMDAAAQPSEGELYSLILSAGFSTAREITGVSGRGVGMDVVRRSVEALRGSLEMASKPGAGLTVTLRLPLTLAIIDGLLIRVADAYFVLPLASSLECVELTGQDIERAHGHHIAMVRGETVPYIRLREYFRVSSAPPQREQIMVVETESGNYGFVVDEVLGNHQTVIKSLGRMYREIPTVSGATILGNGTVALILDPERLVQHAIQNASRKPGMTRGQETRMHGFMKKEGRI